MPFIDWNGNGKIDPTDIAISVALDNEHEDDGDTPPPEVKRKSGVGCVTSVMAFLGVVAFVIMRLTA
jgi:hypothetical protein